jgi:16S rRNA (cytosine967-C5)-methyltransferase
LSVSPKLIDLTVEAVEHVLPLAGPADGLLRDFFRRHHELGQRDRAFVAETTYALLRRRRLLEYLAPNASVRQTVLLALAKLRGLSVRELTASLTRQEKDWLTQIKAPAGEFPAGVVADFPDWLMEKLRQTMPDTAIIELARAMQGSAPLDLRVNTLRASRDEVLATFERDGVEATATPYSPLGVRLKKKIAINKHTLYLNGKVEVQDEGSQLLGFLVAPRRNEMVVDFCAGAGGKTLLMGALMHSLGRLYAFDVSDKRLDGLKPRLKRSGLSNVQPARIADENDTKVKRLAGKIDRVLLDVPCSGLGTLRRNPDFKWRQTVEDVRELVTKQTAILESASRLPKPGGRLVYATCSILEDENENVVEHFLEKHPDFAPLEAQEVLAKQGIELATGRYLQLLPHLHGTDGFFAAVLERKH